MILGLAAAASFYGLTAGPALSQSRIGGIYQEFKSNSCDNFDSSPCTVAFSVLLRQPLKVLKASCTILTSEGGSPSKEITGASLGRLSENEKTYIAGQFLAPIQSEFAGPGQVVLNFLVDTLLVVPKNWKPAIRISRLNNPPIAATCSIVGEEVGAAD
ncbi:hypothetical protein [Hansschlegelia zhihuaiae]|uniref:Uncharacterized protein n=1 Tax=Hansschlegelia zhihuaiae TaxID=405005 RepID=A0A4Q0MMR1_9HYPH|nr:hypothetical protein [Hansschlegelia zhihuaiae]RXF75147.1 hypothetical protein EK403_03640 [Hansschlegelia zhihuaiae]